MHCRAKKKSNIKQLQLQTSRLRTNSRKFRSSLSQGLTTNMV